MLLVQSLTHRSFGHEYYQDRPVAHRDNERLEFLGDSILDLILSDILLESFPCANEGQLSKMRAAIVNEKTLAQIALGLELHVVIKLGKGEIRTGGEKKPSILSSTFEAVIAAVYLDGGFASVYPVIRSLFVPLFSERREMLCFYDYKTQLQEIMQAQWKITPTYHLRESSGPDHAKTFEVEVRMKDKVLATAEGQSKKDAAQKAAELAITLLGASC